MQTSMVMHSDKVQEFSRDAGSDSAEGMRHTNFTFEEQSKEEDPKVMMLSLIEDSIPEST